MARYVCSGRSARSSRGQHDLLAQHVKIIPEEASSYSLVVIDDPSEFDRKVENIRNDTALKAYAEMLSIVGNDCHWTRVPNEQYCEALTGKKKSVTFYSVRLPSVVRGFGSASIFADDFVGSLMEGTSGVNRGLNLRHAFRAQHEHA